MSSSSSSSSSSFSSLDQHLSATSSDQICYVHCNICDTVLAVSVPCTSFFMTVTVRCGHCNTLLPDEIQNTNPNFLISQINANHFGMVTGTQGIAEGFQSHHQVVNRPPEKRQRVPSAYNRFIKEEIQRIKAENPEITHREAFSAAAKNWAHLPHIHLGLMPDQTVKKTYVRQQEEDVMMKDGLNTSANVGVGPYY